MVTLCTIRFNIQQFHVLPTQCNYVFCEDLKSNSDYFPLHNKLIGFYNRDGMCLLLGRDWIFKNYRGNVCFGAQIIGRQLVLHTAVFSNMGSRPNCM